jgi:hypothetical protein
VPPQIDDAKALALIETDGFRDRFFAFDVRRDALLEDARAGRPEIATPSSPASPAPCSNARR